MSTKIDIFADFSLREQKILEELKRAPIFEVTGVVGPSGVSGSKIGDADLWTMLFNFPAWRVDSEKMQSKELTVRRKVSNEDLQRFKQTITPYCVLRIKARVASGREDVAAQAWLEEVVGVDNSDSDLNDQAEQLQKPITYDDEVFGTFKFDRRIKWFSAETIWARKPVSLNLSAEESGDMQESLKTAGSLWKTQEAWNERTREFATDALLTTKNESWLEQDDAALSAEQFKNKMTLQSIVAHPDGSFEFWHHDGDMFWGHSIQVTGNLIDGPNHPEICG